VIAISSLATINSLPNAILVLIRPFHSFKFSTEAPNFFAIVKSPFERCIESLSSGDFASSNLTSFASKLFVMTFLDE
jgi:hypothetical protein